MATCTNLVSVGGGLLQFCQAADKIKVSESGVDVADGAREVKIVDDPVVLAALETDLHTSPGFAPSRNLVARACLVRGRAYVSIAMDDLKRILAAKAAPATDLASMRTDEDAPAPDADD